MRIGLVTPFNPAEFSDRLGPDAPSLHQGATAVHLLAAELLALGHELTVFTSYHGQGPVLNWQGPGLSVYAVPRTGRIPLPGKRLAVACRLRRVMASLVDGLDVIHAQWTYEYALAASAFSLRKPVFCSVRDWAPYQLKMSASLGSRLYWMQSVLIMRKVLKDKHITFIANSDYTCRCLLETDASLPVVIIPNPVRADAILSDRVDYPDHPVLVSVAQMIDARKNIGILLEAFRLYRAVRPQAELHLGGRDFIPGHPRLRPWADLLDGVVLHGWLDRKDLRDLLDHATVMVLPSLEETFGNVLLEGMARRVAVVGGRFSGAVPAVLGEGRYGILCDVTSAEDLCRALLEAEGRAHIDAATAQIRASYASDRIARRHLELYASGLSGREGSFQEDRL